MSAVLDGKALRDIGFRRIQDNTILWRKWNDALTQTDREILMVEAIRDYIVEFCVGEIYAADEPVEAANIIHRTFDTF